MHKLSKILFVVFLPSCGGAEKIVNSGFENVNGGGGANSAMSVGTWVLDALARPPSTSAAMPTGSATYNGQALFSIDTEEATSIAENPSFLSKVTVIANLQDGGVVANFNNFTTGGGLPIPGDIQTSLTNSNGQFLVGAASGSLTFSNGTAVYSGDIFGQFRGENANYFTGDLQLGGSSGDLNGIFAAQR